MHKFAQTGEDVNCCLSKMRPRKSVGENYRPTWVDVVLGVGLDVMGFEIKKSLRGKFTT